MISLIAIAEAGPQYSPALPWSGHPYQPHLSSSSVLSSWNRPAYSQSYGPPSYGSPSYGNHWQGAHAAYGAPAAYGAHAGYGNGWAAPLAGHHNGLAHQAVPGAARYTAITPGAIHEAPLPGHVLSQTALNIAAPAGTLY